ncbi:MAG: hypothetical protein IKC54_05065 [Clostridia bacterium]|nr:hypothetical protein [Clostridia bacterium]
MKLNLTKKQILFGLLGLSVVIMILGILFLVNAMGIADFYTAYADIDNALGKYIIVILTMATGIMLFSNVAMRFEDKKLRNGLTGFITAFAFILTLPLVYVFFSLMPFAAKYDTATVLASGGVAHIGDFTPEVTALSAEALGLNAIDGIMGVNNIYLGFADWFGEGAGLWVILSFMMILGIVFLFEPLIAGICVMKGKMLQLFGKDNEGKFQAIAIVDLPWAKQECDCSCCEHHCHCEDSDAQEETAE